MIRDHHSEYIFWFGDLNFRLELTSEIVLDAIERIIDEETDLKTKNTYLHKLMRSDQLTNLIHRGMIFNGFEEAQWPPPFLPTYKCKMFDPNSHHNLSIYLESQQKYPLNPINSQMKTTTKCDRFTTASNSDAKKTTSATAIPNNDESKRIENPSDRSPSSSSSSSSPTTASFLSNKIEQSERINDLKRRMPNRSSIRNLYNLDSGRVPSYTDRILFQKKSNPFRINRNHRDREANYISNDEDRRKNYHLNSGDNIENGFNADQDKRKDDGDDELIKCIYYNSIGSVCVSDHKPVYALFEVRLDCDGGTKIPYTIKRFSQVVDEFFLQKLAGTDPYRSFSSTEIKMKSNDRQIKNFLPNDSFDRDDTLDSNQTSGFFTRKLFRKNQNPSRSLGTKSSSPQSSSMLLIEDRKLLNNRNFQHSTSKNTHSPSQTKQTNLLNQLNAGAYDRKVYLEALQSRNQNSNGGGVANQINISLESLRFFKQEQQFRDQINRNQKGKNRSNLDPNGSEELIAAVEDDSVDMVDENYTSKNSTKTSSRSSNRKIDSDRSNHNEKQSDDASGDRKKEPKKRSKTKKLIEQNESNYSVLDATTTSSRSLRMASASISSSSTSSMRKFSPPKSSIVCLII
ncbi:inositol polyphosphate 5-phosphatase-like protein [Sarcoptes scabiei]|uniref:Inositol polyphosphate 5-phosphatase-like protein n=1 Tax=Sarcoptes scabiei TaxID=52283 RepID=A0A132A2K4_SARSC|nr:inositol polyphosphate 5-phosphatase-like protein [Sarcoptes scabiei]